jgi:hypothetical protein
MAMLPYWCLPDMNRVGFLWLKGELAGVKTVIFNSLDITRRPRKVKATLFSAWGDHCWEVFLCMSCVGIQSANCAICPNFLRG